MNRRSPIVAAPMAGGISTPELVAAVSAAGGLGFLPAGYLPAERVATNMIAVRKLTDEPFGVNIFFPGKDVGDATEIERYGRMLQPEADRFGVGLGQPRFEDDAYNQKLEVVLRDRPAAVSFTFGCPTHEDLARLRAADIEVWITVTNAEEAALCVENGADVIVLQGSEAGGHRGYFNDDANNREYGLLELIRLVKPQTALPLVAAGGIADAAGVAAALNAGASAVQVGTALMLAPEAGTAQAHRGAFTSPAGTRLTRAFTGRTARGIVNRFMEEHEPDAPRGYPQVHHLTTPIRAAAKAANAPDALHLWAGENYAHAQALSAAQIVAQLTAVD